MNYYRDQLLFLFNLRESQLNHHNDRGHNVLCCGPTGTGKTEILNTIKFHVPKEITYSITTVGPFMLDGIRNYPEVIFIDNNSDEIVNNYKIC